MRGDVKWLARRITRGAPLGLALARSRVIRLLGGGAGGGRWESGGRVGHVIPLRVGTGGGTPESVSEAALPCGRGRAGDPPPGVHRVTKNPRVANGDNTRGSFLRLEDLLVTLWHWPAVRAGLSALVLGTAAFALVSACGRSVAPAAPAPAPSGQSAAPAGALPQRVQVHFAGGTVQGGVSRVPVNLGSSVALVVSSDVADEVHLHGYDRKAEVAPGGTATIDFVADHAGVFEAELESRGIQLVQLEIR